MHLGTSAPSQTLPESGRGGWYGEFTVWPVSTNYLAMNINHAVSLMGQVLHPIGDWAFQQAGNYQMPSC